MAEANQNQALSDQDIEFLEKRTGPIPGQSLTNDTDSKYAWEQSAQFTNRREAEVYILEELTEPEAFIAVTDVLGDDIPIDIVTRTYLFNGYSKGLWDADLMLLLTESVAFILMALAEKVDIDYELYVGDKAENGGEPEEQEKVFNAANESMKKSIQKIQMGNLKAPDSIGKDIEKKLEEIPDETITQAKSLLSKDEPQEKEEETNSLLGAS